MRGEGLGGEGQFFQRPPLGRFARGWFPGRGEEGRGSGLRKANGTLSSKPDPQRIRAIFSSVAVLLDWDVAAHDRSVTGSGSPRRPTAFDRCLRRLDVVRALSSPDRSMANPHDRSRDAPRQGPSICSKSPSGDGRRQRLKVVSRSRGAAPSSRFAMVSRCRLGTPLSRKAGEGLGVRGTNPVRPPRPAP